MSAALSQSKRFLIIALTLFTVVAGLNALQLVNATAANAAPAISSATAGAPKAGITCDQGFSACSGSISTSGGGVPNTGGVITTPGSNVPAGNGFSFLTPCSYLANGGGVTGSGMSNGSAFQLGPKYPINASNAGEALASCQKAADGQQITQRTKPNSGPTGSFAQPELCDPIQIDGQWTAAIGMINQSTAGWTKVAGSQPTKWTIHFNYSCVYPSHKADYFANKWTRYCLMNDSEFRVYYTQTASLAKGTGSSWGGGTLVSSKTGVDPDPYFRASTSKTCAQTLEDTWQGYKLPQASTADGYKGPKYGFYRFSIHGYQILCEGQDPELWTGNKVTHTCDPATKTAIYAHTNYTYTCNSTGFKKDSTPSQSDAEYFLPSGCVTFTCDIDPTKIAQQSPSTPVSVLRNGEQTNTRVGNFTVVDRPASSITGVHNKRVKLNVVSGSSPDNPAVSSNSENEWFKVMNQVTGQRINFGDWTPLANNSNPLKVGLIFYWASDPDTHWQQRQSYQFDATYHVWRQNTVGSAPYLDDIDQPNKVCSNTTTSSKVSVLRSISQVSP